MVLMIKNVVNHNPTNIIIKRNILTPLLFVCGTVVCVIARISTCHMIIGAGGVFTVGVGIDGAGTDVVI